MKMKKKKKLVLPLKKQWFDMIRSGEKPEDYREITNYWIVRFGVKKNTETGEWDLHLFDFDEVEFTLGYPRLDETDKRMIFRNPKLRIGKGNPKWGAQEGKEYFVIIWCNS